LLYCTTCLCRVSYWYFIWSLLCFLSVLVGYWILQLVFAGYCYWFWSPMFLLTPLVSRHGLCLFWCLDLYWSFTCDFLLLCLNTKSRTISCVLNLDYKLIWIYSWKSYILILSKIPCACYLCRLWRSRNEDKKISF
jgi:hypothetical protein